MVSGLILLLAVGIALGLHAGPSKRIAREQGVSVPASASNIVSGGDAWKRWMIDCGAIGTFEIPAADLPAFIGSLTVRKSVAGTGDTIVPGNPRFSDGEDVEPSFVQGRSPSLHGLELTRRTSRVS